MFQVRQYLCKPILGVTRDQFYGFNNIFAKKFGKKMDHNIVLKKNANFFAKNWQESQTFVIICNIDPNTVKKDPQACNREIVAPILFNFLNFVASVHRARQGRDPGRQDGRHRRDGQPRHLPLQRLRLLDQRRGQTFEKTNDLHFSYFLISFIFLQETPRGHF
jgi:hypothetical protein